MPGYVMSFKKAVDQLNINIAQVPHEVSLSCGKSYTWMSPVKCSYADGTQGPMVPGTIVRTSIPKQTYGYRFIYDISQSADPRTTGHEGMTLCIHGRKSHYKNKDSGMAEVTVKLIRAVYAYKQGARGARLEAMLKNLGTFDFHAPVDKDGSKQADNPYHCFGWAKNRTFKRMKQQWFASRHLSADGRSDRFSSCIEQEPWQRIMVVIRMDGSDQDFFTLGVCKYVDGPEDGRYARLQPKEFYRDAIQHANIANLASAADQLFRHAKSAPPEIVKWILGTPSRELEDPATFRASAPPTMDSSVVARPTALRPVEQEAGSSAGHAAAAALLDLGSERQQKEQEADDFQLAAQLQAVDIEEEQAADKEAVDSGRGQYGSMHALMMSDSEDDVEDAEDETGNELEEGEIRENREPLLQPPIPHSEPSNKGKAPARPRSPDADVSDNDFDDDDEDVTSLAVRRANLRKFKARPPTKKVRRE